MFFRFWLPLSVVIFQQKYAKRAFSFIQNRWKSSEMKYPVNSAEGQCSIAFDNYAPPTLNLTDSVKGVI